MYFLNVYFTSHLLLLFKMASKNRNGESGNGMRGIMVTREIRVGRLGIRVGTQGITVAMRGIQVGMRGIRVGMQGIRVRMRGIKVGMRGIRVGMPRIRLGMGGESGWKCGK